MEAPVIAILSVLGLTLLIVIPVLIQWYVRRKKEQKRLRFENVLEFVVRIQNNYYRIEDNRVVLMSDRSISATRRLLSAELGKYFNVELFNGLINKPDAYEMIDGDINYHPDKVISAIWKSTEEL